MNSDIVINMLLRADMQSAKKVVDSLDNIGDSGTKAGKQVADGLTNAEKAAVGAAQALKNYRAVQLQQAMAKMPGPGAVLGGMFGREVLSIQEKEFKKYLNNLAASARIAESQLRIKPKIDFQELDRAAPRIRYALYDVGNQAMFAAAAVSGFGIAAVAAFAKFESAFTSVERTTGATGASLTNLRNQLVELSTVVPVSFEDINRIATLGAQMGIAADGLVQFTKTVSEFSTITGISVDETAQAFGRLSQLMNVPTAQFENLSSAVAFAGVNAVATDKEILAMAESIAASGTQAGLSADEVVGFATALASLKVRPEEARGVLVRLFRTIDLAVSESGTALDDFSKVVNLTATETADLWKQNPSQFVQSFLEGAKAGGSLNEIITALGITNTRELNVIQRLAGNIDILKASLDDASSSYAQGGYASEAYSKRLDDLESRITVLLNSVTALIAEVGAPLGEFLKPIVMILTDVVNGVRKFADSAPILSAIITVVAALGGAFLAIKAGIALSIAGLLAFRTAIAGLKTELGGLGITMRTVSTLIKQAATDLGFTGAAATGATVKYAGLSATLMKFGASATFAAGASRALAIATGPIGMAITALGLALSMVDWSKINEGGSAAGQAMLDAAGGAEALNEAVSKDTKAGAGYREIELAARKLTDQEVAAKRAILEATAERAKLNNATDEGRQAYEDAKKALDDFNESVDTSNDKLGTNTAILGNNTAALILNGLSKMDNGNRDFWMELSSLPPGTQAALEAVGFDAGIMVQKGLEETGGSEKYAEKFANALIVISNSASLTAQELSNLLNKKYGVKVDVSQIEALRNELKKTGPIGGDYIRTLIDGGKASDQQSAAIVKNIAAQERLQSSLGKVGFVAEETDGAVQSLSEQMLAYTKAALSSITSSSSLNDSFANVATSLANTNGTLTTLTEDGRRAIGAWASFMNQSIEFAISNGGDFNTAVAEMASALTVLQAQGKDTSTQFVMLRDVIVKNIISTSPMLKAYAAELSSALDIKDLQSKIQQRAMLARADAVMLLGRGDIASYTKLMAEATNLDNIAKSLGGTTSAVTDFSKVYSDAMKNAAKDTEKAKTALELLLEKIAGALKYTNIFVKLRGSLDSFGDSIRENGMNFNSFTEGGRANINALQGVITELANKSGGNVKKFANDLASLRQLLASSGAKGNDLKIIDAVLKSLGVTGKASKKTMDELAKALGNVGSQRASLVKIVEAIRKIAQEVTSSIDANFAYTNSIEEVTLGWEQMADAQKQAADKIEELKEQALDAADAITQARIAIDDANASIAELTANRSKLEYQLQIAIKYGDTLRAQEIGAKLAEIDADVAAERQNIAEANREIAASQATINEVNTELTRPRSATEIIEENRALRTMANRYGEMTTFMMMNSEEGADLSKIVNDQVAAFKANAIAMGYTETQAEAVASVLRNSLLGQIDAVNKSKMDLGITVDTSEAAGDVTTFVNDANELLKGVKPAVIKADTVKAKKDVVDLVRDINAQLALIKDRTVTVNTIYQSTGGSTLGVIRRASGGLVTGPGSSTSDSIAARLSNGEYVVKASAVKYYGTDFMNALNNMSLQSAGMSTIQVQSGASSTVYLSPEDRALLRAAIDRPIALYTDNATIAKSANDGNAILAQRGIR